MKTGSEYTLIQKSAIIVMAAFALCLGQYYGHKQYSFNEHITAIEPIKDGQGNDLIRVRTDSVDVAFINPKTGTVTPTPQPADSISATCFDQDEDTLTNDIALRITKVTASGDTAWSREYTDTTINTLAHITISAVEGDNHLLALNQNSSVLPIWKIDTNGDILWKNEIYLFEGPYDLPVKEGAYPAAPNDWINLSPAYPTKAGFVGVKRAEKLLWIDSSLAADYNASDFNRRVLSFTPTGDFRTQIIDTSLSISMSAFVRGLIFNWFTLVGYCNEEEREQFNNWVCFDNESLLMVGHKYQDFLETPVGEKKLTLAKISREGDLLWKKSWCDYNDRTFHGIIKNDDGTFVAVESLMDEDSITTIYLTWFLDDFYAKSNNQLTQTLPRPPAMEQPSCSRISAPDEMTISSNGAMSWIPPAVDSFRLDSVSCLVTDGANTDTISFYIVVEKNFSTAARNPSTKNHCTAGAAKTEFTVTRCDRTMLRIVPPAGMKSFSIHDFSGRLIDRIETNGAPVLWKHDGTARTCIIHGTTDRQTVTKSFVIVR